MNEEEKLVHYRLLKSKKDVLLSSVREAEKHNKKKSISNNKREKVNEGRVGDYLEQN